MTMYGWASDENFARLHSVEERWKWKIMYNENNRSPTHSVPHYITYLRRYVNETSHQRALTPDKNSEKLRTVSPQRMETRMLSRDTSRSADSISPLSYFIRKLKLDLKMSYPTFVEEFVQAPNNGLRLLLSLLKNLQSTSSNSTAYVSRAAAKGTLRMEEYKQNMVDEQDCLLCIKYTLRIRSAVDEIVEHNNGLFTVTTCILSNFSRSRITALEILTLIVTGPSSVDKVLDSFTSMRIKYAESTRFKMLLNMMHTRGVSHVLFQVSCLRLLNTLLNMCKSANMRVFLQYEMEEAGLDWGRLHENAQGNGLEYDDLRREIQEWKMRYIDVDTLLRKIKADIRAEYPGSAMTEFQYDQHYGPVYSTAVTDVDNFHSTGLLMDYKSFKEYVHQQEHRPPYSPKQGDHPHRTSTVRATSASLMPKSYSTLDVDVQPSASEQDQRSGKHSAGPRPEQPVYEVISCTPSPLFLNHSHAGSSSSRGGTSVNNISPHGNKMSVTTEISEPYGLIRKTRPAPEPNPAATTKNENWILGSPRATDGNSDRNVADRSSDPSISPAERHRRAMKAGRYDSGVSVTDQDGELGDEIAEMYWENFYPRDKIVISKDDHGIHKTKNVEKEVVVLSSKSSDSGAALSSRNGSSEPGPLRWYNPGISKLQPFHPLASQQQIFYGKTGTYHQFVTGDGPESDAENPRTPSPDYTDDTIKSQNEEPPNFFPDKVESKPTIVITTSHIGDTPPKSSAHHRPPVRQQQQFQRSQNIRRRSAEDTSKPPRPPLPTEYRNGNQKDHQAENNSKPPTQISANISTTPLGKDKESNLLQPPLPPRQTGYPKRSADDVSKSTSTTSNISVHAESSQGKRLTSTQEQKQKDEKTSATQSRESVKTKPPIPPASHSDVSHADVGDKTNLRSSQSAPNIGNRKDNVVTSKTSSSNNKVPGTSGQSKGPITKEGSQSQTTLKPQDSVSNGVDSVRSYSAEIGRVLSDLDQTLETHGWQASLKKQVKQNRPPLVAYV